MFARLENTKHGQCLAELTTKTDDDGQFGPCVRFRVDAWCTVEIVKGPFGDDDAGWAEAERVLAEADLDETADFLFTACNDLLGPEVQQG